MGEGWATGIGLTLIGLLVLCIGWSIISLPFAWRNQIRARARVSSLMSVMATLYNELGSAGPVSANRAHELATKASEIRRLIREMSLANRLWGAPRPWWTAEARD